MRVIISILCAALLGCAGFCGEAAADLKPPAIEKIVLYKHGIGFFERRGKVTGNAKLTLSFKPEQMKDLLASFYVLDMNGGKVSAILYETRDPLSKQLEGIQISVPENAALSQFLVQLKGAKIGITAGGEKITGRIMGIEPVVEKQDGNVVKTSYRLVLLSDGGTIKNVDLLSATEISLQDPALQKDLERLLTLTLDAKYTDRKTVTIEAQGEGERELRIGYLIEQPIWKASYRILFDPDPKAAALLQGWAIAENTTSDDWNDVQIAFVAGNPLSYVMDLYTPYYPERPHVPIPGLAGLSVDWDETPEANAAGQVERFAAKDKVADGRRLLRESNEVMAKAQKQAALAPSAAPLMEQQLAADKPMAEVAQESVAALARGTPVGELFSYEAKEKVSIPRGKAALIPIISNKIKGERVVYYRQAFSPRPADAYILINDTDLTLEAGAVTFFEDGTSLGSGILSHVLVPGAKEILPYAVEAGISVTPELNSEQQPAYKGTLADGVLTLTAVETTTSTWKIANKGKEDKTVVLDQPVLAGYKLVEPAKPEEEVDGYYRFRIAAKPGETKEFKVAQRHDVFQTLYLANLNEEQIRFYAQQQYFDEKTKAFFGELAQIQTQRAALRRDIQGRQNEVQRLSDEQNRLRQNLNTLRQSPKEDELRAKWLKSLADTEDKLVALRTQIDDAQGKLRQLDEQLAKKVQEYKGE